MSRGGFDVGHGKRRPPAPRRRGPQERRELPRDSTGREAGYLAELERAGTPLVVQLASGEAVQGVIASFDGNQIEIDRADDGRRILRRSEIRYLYEE
jgi:hypothetical protein